MTRLSARTRFHGALAPAPPAAPFALALALAALAMFSGVSGVSGVPARADHPRLGDDVAPTFQAVRLHVDPDRTDYSGSVAVDLEVRRPTREVRFHARGQTFQRVALTRAGEPVAVEVERGPGGFSIARSATPLAPGAYRMEIDFTGPFNTQAVALYRTEAGGHGYAFTQFEAAEARGAFPCWDEPGFKIPWQLTVEAPAALQVVSNSPVERERPAGSGVAWKEVTFARTPPLPSYLIALAVGPFDVTPIPGLSVPGRIVSPAGQGRLAGLAASIAPPALAALERYFGQPYPYAKLDFIAVPEFWPGAMENAGAITFADSILLADPHEVTPQARGRLTYVMVHEMAHMWFGDLVTMGWWDDLWLNESFADWMAVKVADQLEPRLGIALHELKDQQEAMAGDARPSSLAIHRPVAEPAEAMEQVRLVYDKGKAVLSMFEAWMGPEVFQRGVVEHLRARAWGNAVAADFWAALERASGQPEVTRALAGFIDQPGLPLVEVAALPGGRLRLSQRRFLPQGAAAPPLSWTIPVGLKVSDGREVRTVRVLLPPAGQEVEVPGLERVAWVMPNLAGAGYYRWEIPEEMLPVLTDAAPAALDARERVALASDLGALLDAGRLHGDRYLAALAGLANDSEPAVLEAVFDGFARVRAILPETSEGAFAAYLRGALGPALARIGAAPRPGESESAALMRPRLLALLGDEGQDPTVQAWAAGETRKLLADPAALDAALAGVALQLAATRGDRALFDELRRRFERAEVPAERRRYLEALGSFRDPALTDAALRYALEGPLRPNERMSIPRDIASSGERGRQQVYDWTTANFDRIAATTPPASRGFFTRIADGCSPERLAKARQFFAEPSRGGEGVENRLQQTADRVTQCAALREREGAAVDAYLKGVAAKGK